MFNSTGLNTLTQGAIFPPNGSIHWRFLHFLFVSRRFGCSPFFPGMRIRGGGEAAVRRRWGGGSVEVATLPPPSESLWQRESHLADEQRGSRWAGWGLSAKTAGVTPHLPPQELPRLNDHTQREWEGSNGKPETGEQRGRDAAGSGRRSATH